MAHYLSHAAERRTSLRPGAAPAGCTGPGPAVRPVAYAPVAAASARRRRGGGTVPEPPGRGRAGCAAPS
ncbi:hypothetical protein GCM10017688_60860 [Streptomyces ramulosus]